MRQNMLIKQTIKKILERGHSTQNAPKLAVFRSEVKKKSGAYPLPTPRPLGACGASPPF